jgi:hypothetical protein
MKKLLLVLISIIALSSCYRYVENSVVNPKKETTVELQELPKDTVVISIDGHILYVFDDNNQVVYKTISPKEDSFPIYTAFFLLLIGMGIVVGVLIGVQINI